ncbi:actin-like protein arp8 [Mortierella claussenii]|nr:actin-like protein arp8 [Mortierella claussenii]
MEDVHMEDVSADAGALDTAITRLATATATTEQATTAAEALAPTEVAQEGLFDEKIAALAADVVSSHHGGHQPQPQQLNDTPAVKEEEQKEDKEKESSGPTQPTNTDESKLIEVKRVDGTENATAVETAKEAPSIEASATMNVNHPAETQVAATGSESAPALLQSNSIDAATASSTTDSVGAQPAKEPVKVDASANADASTANAAPTTETSESKEAADTTATAESALPPPPPVRSYIPQFKFTTFAAMTQLPTRNVTSGFLRTEKNFVLKDVSKRQKRRKRKSGEEMTRQEGDQEGAAKAEDMVEGEGDAKAQQNGLRLKRKKSDEFSAIRKGIFAEDDDKQDEDENEEEKDADRRKQVDDEDELYSSDSDSEESIVNETDENGETKSSSEAGKKIIVIHPGSRILRVGRASDAYPIATPHCIARRIRTLAATIPNGKSSPPAVNSVVEGQDAGASVESSTQDSVQPDSQNPNVDVDNDTAMDVDGEEDAPGPEEMDVVNDRYLQEIEYDLKLRMKQAKRRPVTNAKSQVRSFNTSTRPERILDHNDPYKVEWTDPKAEGEYIIGQKALNLPPSKDHNFKLFWPIVGSKLNDRDYVNPRVVVADLETIWTKVIQEDLGIEPNKFRKHYALLVIPDLYSKLYVIELINMLLGSMQFRGVMIQQESVCASYGAGVSAACVVDIGAEVTKVSCVEDGICIPNSRAMLKYGGDDITRCFTALVKRTGFPYEELDLAQTYDWRLMEELKEKWCTMNEADLTVQVYNFFVRRPEKHTEKYQVKVYDEVALSPMCLFFPGVIRRWIEERETNPNFAKVTNYEDINEDAPPISLTNQAQKKSTAAAAIAAAARAGTPSLTAPGDEASVNGAATPTVGTPGATPAATPAPSASTLSAPAGSGSASAAATGGIPVAPAEPPVIVFAMEPSVMTTTKSWEIAGTIGKDHFSSLVALDVVVAQSISNCGSEDRSKKLYGSIILVGGGGMIKGFDRVLEDRLFQALPATLTTVEKVEVLPSPRDMDPRLLVWKGASVLGKLETAKELWIKPLEWQLMGRKVLRDKSLFVWSKD